MNNIQAVHVKDRLTDLIENNFDVIFSQVLFISLHVFAECEATEVFHD